MGRLFALGILGTLASASIVPPSLALSGASFGDTGSQHGSVTGVITTSAKGAAPVRVTVDQHVCGDQLPDEAIVVDAQGRLANAVVILTGVKRNAPREVLVLNEKCRFMPRVQIVAPKGSVKTTSKDAVLHTTNAQLENGRSLFNVALPIPGITITRTIRGSGTVRLICNTHPWMRGWMVVTDEAAVISGADGRFTIDNVPPGTYDLRVWHEALRGAPQKVTVSGGKPTDLSIVLR